MSSPGLDEAVAVDRRGVHVEKSFAAEEFPVPAIKFVISSSLSEPVDVRLTDDIPEGFPMDAVGFHPDYESENWTAYKDNRVEYERRLDPGEEVVTVYGIRIDEPDDARAFLAEPTVEEVVTADAEAVEAIVGDDGNQVVREVLAGDGQMPGLDDEETEPAAGDEAPEEAPASLDLDDEGDLRTDETPAAADDAGGDEEVEAPDGLDLDDGDGADLSLDDPEEDGAVADDPTTDAATGDDPATADEAPAELDLEEDLSLDDSSESETADPDLEDDEGTTESADVDDETAAADEDDADPVATVEETADAEGSGAPEPRTVATDTTAAVSRRDADAEPLDRTAGGAAEPGDEFEVEAETTDAAATDGETDVAAAEESDPTTDDRPTAASGAAAGGLAAALAAEIRSGDVAEEDLAVLKEELDVGGVPRSVDVRIRRLQSQVDDLDAYAGALEEFLDEEGTGQELIDGFRADVTDLSETVADIESSVADGSEAREDLRAEVDDVRDSVESVRERVDEVETTLADTEERVAAVESHVETVDERVADVAGRTDAAHGRLDEVAGTLDDHTEWLEYVEGSLEETDGRLDEVAATAEGTAESVASLDEEMGDVRNDVADVDAGVAAVEEQVDTELQALREEVADIRAELEEVEDFRDRLSDAFGA
jgi:archaellum component FlaC